MSTGIDWLESLLVDQKADGLTAGVVPAERGAKTPALRTAVTRKTRTAKRAYKARARRCMSCHQAFTPKKNRAAKTCSERCRKNYNRAKARKLRQANPQPVADRPLVLHTCLWCSGTWLALNRPGTKYCSDACKVGAYKFRRYAAIEPLARLRGWSVEKAAAVVERDGMRKITPYLKRAGLVYDDLKRGWVPALRLVKTAEDESDKVINR